MQTGDRGQTSFEYVLFISAGLLFIAIVLLATRGNVIGSAASNVAVHATDIPEKVGNLNNQAPKSNPTCSATYSAEQRTVDIYWKTDIPASTAVKYGTETGNLAYSQGSPALKYEHVVNVKLPDGFNALRYECISCETKGNCEVQPVKNIKTVPLITPSPTLQECTPKNPLYPSCLLPTIEPE